MSCSCDKWKKIKELVEKVEYSRAVLDYTTERSFGNYDDVFADGYNCGFANAIEEIKEMIEDIERGGY